MNRFLHIALLPLLAVALLMGCDSNDDETPDSERIVGTWQASEARVNTPVPGVSFPVLDASNADQVTLTFGADERYTITLDGTLEIDVPQTDETITIPGGTGSGTYQFASDDQIRFGVDGTFDTTLNVGYRFRSDDRLDLSVEDTEEGKQVIAFLFGLESDSPILDLVAGGTLSLRRQ